MPKSHSKYDIFSTYEMWNEEEDEEVKDEEEEWEEGREEEEEEEVGREED